MEIYETEDQQLNAIKQFLFKNKAILMFALVAVFVVIIGSGYWRHHTQVLSIKASDLYQEMLVADFQHDAGAVDLKGRMLMKDFANTPYSQLAAMLLAKTAVAQNDFAKAEESLRWIITKKSTDELVLHIATERLARVLQQRGDINGALALLESSKAKPAYITIFEETKGDLYLAKGDVKQAKAAYLKAFANMPAGAQSPLLQMKLMDLGVSEAEINGIQREHHDA